MAELGGKDEEAPELLAVVAARPDELDRIPLRDRPVVVMLDRPANPGNLGTVIRSADAFGAAGIVVCGRSADPYDPRAVRASTGSLFALPVVRLDATTRWSPSSGMVAWRSSEPTRPGASTSTSTTSPGRPRSLVGNESAGLSAAWREAADAMVRIPIGGGASSLNAATATVGRALRGARQRRG